MPRAGAFIGAVRPLKEMTAIIRADGLRLGINKTRAIFCMPFRYAARSAALAISFNRPSTMKISNDKHRVDDRVFRQLAEPENPSSNPKIRFIAISCPISFSFHALSLFTHDSRTMLG
jgi:hypothetical protein